VVETHPTQSSRVTRPVGVAPIGEELIVREPVVIAAESLLAAGLQATETVTYRWMCIKRSMRELARFLSVQS
jgi:hypothetical protein